MVIYQIAYIISPIGFDFDVLSKIYKASEARQLRVLGSWVSACRLSMPAVCAGVGNQLINTGLLADITVSLRRV